MNLNEIKNITKSITDHQVRIKKLEQNIVLNKNMSDLRQQNSSIIKDVANIKNEQIDASIRPSPEIIISGIPTQLELEPSVIVENILSSLNSP